MTNTERPHNEDFDVSVKLTNIARLIAREAARGYVFEDFGQ